MTKNTVQLMKKTALPDALAALLAGYTVFAPTGEAERLAFSQIDAGSLNSVNLKGTPALSAKEALFPRTETLFGVELKTNEILPEEPEGTIAVKTAIFGVRPCDTRGILNLDCVFLEKGYIDTAYAKRRENLTVITLACNEIPFPTCFCTSMGGGPEDREGADVFITETADPEIWSVSFNTKKGLAVMKAWENASVLTEPADAGAATKTGAGDAKPAAAKIKAPAPMLSVKKPKDLAAKLTAAFEDPAWARFSEACIGCGTCSYICPTCYCFDIGMETGAGTATEFRCWDCCMFSDYTRMAGGHDPRPTKKERLRNRYLHKLAYFDERYGKTLCVGCGRCILKCPAGLDIASIIEWGATL